MSKELFEKIQEELYNIQNEVFEGELSNLDGLIKMRQSKEQCKKCLEIIKSFEDSRLNEIAHDASEYPKGYQGYIVTLTNGRKMFNFKGIEDIEELDASKKKLEEQYKNAFEGFQKGTVQTVEEDGQRYWIDSDGQLRKFPELNMGKSFLTIKKLTNK